MSDGVYVAFESETTRARVRELLEAGGISVLGAYRSGAEIKRAVGKSGGGVIICGFKLSDMTSDTLAFDLDGIALVLVAARPDLLEMCENPDVYTLPMPAGRSELLASVRMLMQAEQKHRHSALTQRTEAEKALVERAKKLIMDKYSLSEPEAHRFLQRASMDAGAKMADTAKRMLERA